MFSPEKATQIQNESIQGIESRGITSEFCSHDSVRLADLKVVNIYLFNVAYRLLLCVCKMLL